MRLRGLVPWAIVTASGGVAVVSAVMLVRSTAFLYAGQSATETTRARLVAAIAAQASAVPAVVGFGAAATCGAVLIVAARVLGRSAEPVHPVRIAVVSAAIGVALLGLSIALAARAESAWWDRVRSYLNADFSQRYTWRDVLGGAPPDATIAGCAGGLALAVGAAVIASAGGRPFRAVVAVGTLALIASGVVTQRLATTPSRLLRHVDATWIVNPLDPPFWSSMIPVIALTGVVIIAAALAGRALASREPAGPRAVPAASGAGPSTPAAEAS